MKEISKIHLADFFNGKMPPEAFVTWVKEIPSLKEVLSEDDYRQLTSTDLRLEDTRQLISKYIDWAQFEKEKLAETLLAIIWKDNVPEALADVYRRYRSGQRFLQSLSDCYSEVFLQFETTGSRPKKDPSLQSAPSRHALLEQVYPDIAADAKRRLALLVAERIRFTGTYTPDGQPEYTEQ